MNGPQAHDLRADRIRAELQQRLQPQSLEIVDDGARHIGHAHEGSGHFTVRIIATAFAGKPRLQRHRMVYEALETLMQGNIHALSIKAMTPEETLSV
ncbi:MAG TPA: BolA family protein [Gammaproteobacteria bacterium]|nr:BolA family protein [Gammaproteobacteria bacterium]